MRKLISLLFLIVPFVASAQKDLFMNEFNGLNNWFFSRPNIALVQKYVYYGDTAMVQALDSATVTVLKTNAAIHYKAGGLESFSDSGYMVKINHSGKYMVVSKIAKTDTAQLKAIFNQGFSGFAAFRRTGTRDGSAWELSGGSAGINSVRIVLDLKGRQIRSLEMFMAGNHPLVSLFKKAGQTTDPTIIIKVAYQYPPDATNYNAGTLSDFINLNGVNITPAAKYKDYRIKLIPGKQ